MTRGISVHAWVQDEFGVELRTLDPVTDGADEAAELWRGMAADGTRYAVKLSGGGTPAGLVVTGALASNGVPGIAGPLATRDGRLWDERDGRRLSLVPWVSDERALAGGMGAARWRALGELLRRVHDTPVTNALAEALPREQHEYRALAQLAQDVDRRVRGDVEDPLAHALAESWDVDTVPALVARADALEAELRGRAAERVVCHGDPHLGNVLLGGAADGVWLIDWDDAVLAPREQDLLFAIGGVLPFAPVSAQQQAWFFDGYGAVEVDPDRLAHHRCIRALEDLAVPAAQVLDRERWGEEERAEALGIVRSVLSPTGLVRLALER